VIDPYLSIVIPVYNEAENLDPLWSELWPVLDRIGRSCEVLFVDDGSVDGSGRILDRIRGGSQRVRIIRLQSHSGQSAALDAGFRSARGEIVVTMDSDLQNDPADIPRLLEGIGDLDAVVGYRTTRQDPWLRRVSSRVANAIRNYLSDEKVIDTGCSLKAFRRRCLDRIRLYDGMHRFLPTLVKMEGFTVAQVAVCHRPRLWGRSKYNLQARLLHASWDLLTVRWMKRRRLRYRLLPEAEKVNAKGQSSPAE